MSTPPVIGEVKDNRASVKENYQGNSVAKETQGSDNPRERRKVTSAKNNEAVAKCAHCGMETFIHNLLSSYYRGRAKQKQIRSLPLGGLQAMREADINQTTIHPNVDLQRVVSRKCGGPQGLTQWHCSISSHGRHSTKWPPNYELKFRVELFEGYRGLV